MNIALLYAMPYFFMKYPMIIAAALQSPLSLKKGYYSNYKNCGVTYKQEPFCLFFQFNPSKIHSLRQNTVGYWNP